MISKNIFKQLSAAEAMEACESDRSRPGSPASCNPQIFEERNFRLVDFLVILLCLAGAAFCLNLFRLDLFQSISSRTNQPVGTITVKRNNVQRRLMERVLWSRLAVESPVYLGDLIRVTEYSAATLRVNDDVVDINENTLIRISAALDGEGRVVIDLGSGSVNVSGGAAGEGETGTGNGGTVALSVMGRVVAPQAGTTLSAFAGEGGITLQVNEGNVVITGKDGQSRSLAAGDSLTLDTGGVEQAVPVVVVTQPRPNAHYIANGSEPLAVRFAWNTANIKAQPGADGTQPLRLEIAADPAFTRVMRTVESGANADSADITLGIGAWYWRHLYYGTVLSAGEFSIASAEIPTRLSPIQGSVFRYRENPPPVRFEWKPAEGASSYILEAGLTPDLSKPLLTRQTAVPSVVEQVPEAGTWYWRVKPIFPSGYQGSAAFSQAGSFRVEQNDKADSGSPAVTLELPELLSAPSLTSVVVSETQPEPVAPEASVAATPPATEPAPVTPAATTPPAATPAPPPPLPGARNLLPADKQQVNYEDLRSKRRIDFSWAPVTGANAYIVTLYQQRDGGRRRQVFQTDPLRRTTWTLDKLDLLDNGTFVWRVEAVNVNRNGKIERRGRTTENTFVVDIPRPGSVEIQDIEVLHDQ